MFEATDSPYPYNSKLFIVTTDLQRLSKTYFDISIQLYKNEYKVFCCNKLHYLVV